MGTNEIASNMLHLYLLFRGRFLKATELTLRGPHTLSSQQNEQVVPRLFTCLPRMLSVQEWLIDPY
jgi:hypothetical protein